MILKLWTRAKNLLKSNKFINGLSIFSFAAVFILTIIFAFSCYLEYKLVQKERVERYKSEIQKIEFVINDSFEYLENFANYLADQIVTNDITNAESINSLLGNALAEDKSKDDVIIWEEFSFSNPSGLVLLPYHHKLHRGLIINSSQLDHAQQDVIQYSKKNPGKLYLGNSDYDNKTSDFIITAGYGVTSEGGKFYGTLITGLNILKLKHKIQNYLFSDSTKFLILNKDYKLINASGAKNDANLAEMSNILQNLNDIDYQDFILAKKIKNKDIEYSAISKSDPNNYIILVGENEEALSNELIARIFPEFCKLILLIIIMLNLLYLFKKRILFAITIISQQLSKLVYGKRLTKIPNQNIKEIDELASSINLFVNDFHKEQKDKLYLEQKVRQRTLDLEKALAVKTEFLNNMSHEIRTPIQGFLGLSEGLVDIWDKADDEKKFDLAQKVAFNARRLTNLVGNLLDLTQFNDGMLYLDLKKIDLVKSVEEIIEESKTLYLKGKKIKISLKTRQNKAIIIADYERMSQVLRNLVINAIKFSPDNSHIKLELADSNLSYSNKKNIRGIHFSITDRGVGIPINEFETIFDSFQQSSRTKTKAGGTGLGLSISKKIIKAHNGKIWAENNKDGQGASFHFVIPEIQEKTMNNLDFTEEKVIQSNKKKQIQSANIYLKPKTIMVVDDEETVLPDFSRF